MCSIRMILSVPNTLGSDPSVCWLLESAQFGLFEACSHQEACWGEVNTHRC